MERLRKEKANKLFACSFLTFRGCYCLHSFLHIYVYVYVYSTGLNWITINTWQNFYK